MRGAIIAGSIVLLGCASVVVLDDAGRDGGTIDVVGTWRHCSSTLVLGADRSATFRDHREACDYSGTWTLSGSTLTMQYDGGSCGPRTMVRIAVRSTRGLTLFDEEGVTTKYADDATPFGNWRFDSTSGDPRSSIVRRVGGPPDDPFGSGCYWSADGECGGLFSCSGRLAEWRVEGTTLQASTLCGGGCVCTSIILGTFEGENIAGTFRGFNCERSFEGTFAAVPIEDP